MTGKKQKVTFFSSNSFDTFPSLASGIAFLGQHSYLVRLDVRPQHLGKAWRETAPAPATLVPSPRNSGDPGLLITAIGLVDQQSTALTCHLHALSHWWPDALDHCSQLLWSSGGQRSPISELFTEGIHQYHLAEYAFMEAFPPTTKYETSALQFDLFSFMIARTSSYNSYNRILSLYP